MQIVRRGIKKFLFCLLLGSLPAFGLAQSVKTSAFAHLLQQRLQEKQRLKVADTPIVEWHMLNILYAKNHYQPLWQQPENIRALRRWIAQSSAEGLNPSDYHHNQIQAMLQQPIETVEQQVDLELLLSDAFAMLGFHLSTGKADPASLFKEWNHEVDYSRMPSSTEVLNILAKGQIDALFSKLRPSNPEYRHLKQALADYRQIARAGGWPQIDPGPTLHPGDRTSRVAQLRARLRFDFPKLQDTDDPQYFDDELKQAVEHFQAHHLLESDGIVGKDTLAALNIPIEKRIEQLRVNLERLRWIYHGIPEHYYGVDLAAYELFYVGEDDWRSPVQVGKTYHQTPIFRDRIRIVEINPTWTVPMSITRRELAKPLLEDPLGYLQKKNMELLTPDGQVLDPSQVDWSQITPKNFPYVLRQRAGPDNALGRIKFLFPNKYAVYLHDTPSKKLFSRTRRAFSHGCIRVGKPLELGARLLAANDPSWTITRIQEIIDTGKTQRIKLKKPVPILILYLTATTKGEDGAIQFRPDIYRRDAKVLAALNAPVQEKGRFLGEQYKKQLGHEW